MDSASFLIEGISAKISTVICPKKTPDRPKVVVATVDPQIRKELERLLQGFAVDAIWVQSVRDVKKLLVTNKIAACLCAFWLQDGTYRELVRHVRRGRADVPIIIVSAPDCSSEYRDYLTAMNIGVLDFLCYPYRKVDLEGMLGLAIGNDSGSSSSAAVQETPPLEAGEAA